MALNASPYGAPLKRARTTGVHITARGLVGNYWGEVRRITGPTEAPIFGAWVIEEDDTKQYLGDFDTCDDAVAALKEWSPPAG